VDVDENEDEDEDGEEEDDDDDVLSTQALWQAENESARNDESSGQTSWVSWRNGWWSAPFV
jgi:hypothetical protein